MKNADNKTLMFCVSNNLSKPEAISFARTLDPNEKYYLVKTHENPKAKHLAMRQRYVIVRNPKKMRSWEMGGLSL
jgi:hypothetical protein